MKLSPVMVVHTSPFKSQENSLLEKCFSAPRALQRLRSGLSGPHIDSFADSLAQHGYAHATAIRYYSDPSERSIHIAGVRTY